MFDTVEEVIFDSVVAEKGRTIEFNSTTDLVRFRGLFFAARARMAKREMALAWHDGTAEPDPALWGGNLSTIRKGPTTLWVGPKGQASLGMKKVR